MALASLRIFAGWPGSSLLANAISTKLTWAHSSVHTQCPQFRILTVPILIMNFYKIKFRFSTCTVVYSQTKLLIMILMVNCIYIWEYI